MNIKVFTHITIDASDDFPKAAEFLTRKIKQTAHRDVSFTFDIEKTNVLFKDAPALLQSLDGKYDAVMYLFDRPEGTSSSLCWWMGKSAGIYVSTVNYDDAVGGTWMTIAHELMHSFFYKLKSLGIQTFDPMDAMYVKGIMTPYYKNWEPEALDGNFATAFAYLANYWDKIAPQAPTSPTAPSLPTATILRSTSTKHETLGVLTASNGAATFICKTLELPWLNNQKMISCIPPGTYMVKKVFWARKLKYFYQVQNVPGRGGIFFHEGNFYKNYEGCIGLGAGLTDLNNDGEIDITSTLATMKAFDGFMGGKPFQLIIR